jgi:hypothetical protein
MQKLSDTILGLGSISLIETIPQIQQTAQLDIPNIVQSIIQLIVAVGTLLAMFKKKKLVNS